MGRVSTEVCAQLQAWGKKQFYGVLCSWIARYAVSQQADTFILGRRKDGGGFLVLSHLGEGSCKASSDKSWPRMFCQDGDQSLLVFTGFKSNFYWSKPAACPSSMASKWDGEGRSLGGDLVPAWDVPAVLLQLCA